MSRCSWCLEAYIDGLKLVTFTDDADNENNKWTGYRSQLHYSVAPRPMRPSARKPFCN